MHCLLQEGVLYGGVDAGGQRRDGGAAAESVGPEGEMKERRGRCGQVGCLGGKGAGCVLVCIIRAGARETDVRD